jgi:hypothetical protein
LEGSLDAGGQRGAETRTDEGLLSDGCHRLEVGVIRAIRNVSIGLASQFSACHDEPYMATLRRSSPSPASFARPCVLTVALAVVACGNDYSAYRVFIEVGGYQAVVGMAGSAMASGGGGADGANGGAAGTGGTAAASTGGTGTGGSSPSTGGASTGGASSGGSTGTGGSSSGACAGVLDSGICWYQGGPGASCATTCSTHGGPSPQAASHVGIASQGGSSNECTRILGLLGMTGTVTSGTRSVGEGVGCHVFPGPAYWWLSSPAYSDTASLPNVRIVCGCAR